MNLQPFLIKWGIQEQHQLLISMHILTSLYNNIRYKLLEKLAQKGYKEKYPGIYKYFLDQLNSCRDHYAIACSLNKLI
jgi:hypothetical protein